MSQWTLNYTDVNMTLVGFGIFLFVFIGATLLTFHKERKKHFEEIEILPLDIVPAGELSNQKGGLK